MAVISLSTAPCWLTACPRKSFWLSLSRILADLTFSTTSHIIHYAPRNVDGVMLLDFELEMKAGL